MNHEHYSDPTAEAAIRKISYKDKKLNLVIQIIKLVVALGGFKLCGRIILVDKNNKKFV